MKYYSIVEFAKAIGKTTKTLRNLDKNGKLKPARVKDLTICSDIVKPYKNINKTQKIRKLKKKKRRLQRQISKKYLMNKKGDSYCKTSNIIKTEKKLLKLNHRLTDICHDYLHQTTTEIIN